MTATPEVTSEPTLLAPRARIGAGMLALAIVGIAVVLAIWGDLIAPHNSQASVFAPNRPPNPDNFLGTDGLGRDVASRIIVGARHTVILGFGATALALIAGTTLGSIAGYFGGWVDAIISRTIEAFLTIPNFFLAIVLVAFLGGDLLVVTMVLGATMWPVTARLMRAEALALRDRSFVEAARVCGLGPFAVIRRHILPNGIAPILANSSLQVAEAILISAGLAFIGLGDPASVSWGKMIQDGQATFQTSWWLVAFPGLALAILLLALHTLADVMGSRLGKRT